MDVEPRLHVGDRVVIRPWVDPVIYLGMTTNGNEGTITKVDKDKFGLPKVFVEWDKNHWTYNGAPDCWTFEDHFDIVEPPIKVEMNMDADRKSELLKILKEFAAEEAAAKQKSEVVEDLDVTLHQNKSEDNARYDALNKLEEEIAEAEAFVVVTIKRKPHAESEHGVLYPSAFSFSVDPVAELLAMVHMSSLATKSYQDLVVEAISSLQDDES